MTRSVVSPLAAACLLLIASPGPRAQQSDDPRARADAAYENGRYEECARLYAGLLESPTAGENTAYNAACCFALAGNADQAFHYLDAALDRGYRNLTWLEGDTDLTSLHTDPRWSPTLERCREAWDMYLATINVELLRMFEEDQADRRGERSGEEWNAVARRDSLRRERAREILEAGGLAAADDYFHAALIFQHGWEPEDYRLAHDLALRAVELDSTHATARWLSAATWDRYLWNTDRPQWYGTQRKLIDGEWTIEPIDTTAVTDALRRAHGVPPLAAARERVASLNANLRDQER